MRDEFEFGCVMVFFENPLLLELQSLINSEDLHEFGLETEPHASVLYGLHSGEIEPSLILSKCASFKYSDIDVTGISAFKNLDFDVLKIDVDSPDLRFLNHELSKLPNTSQFDNYLPHSTIAYLKPNTSHKYIEKMNEILERNPLRFSPSKVVYSTGYGTKYSQRIMRVSQI